MLISRVKIDNFRIYKNQEFEFGDNKLILLTGENGFGKTTLFDAIEWCLTGKISRLKKCYDGRNTSQAEKERQENRKGLIKNSSCNHGDTVKVTLTLKIDGEEVNVYREQIEDSLYVTTELKYIGEVLPELRTKIEQYIANESYYKYHVCDVFKSYNFMNSNRQTIKDEFEDFIKHYPLADSFSNKLYELQNSIDKKIGELINKKTPENIINDSKKELDTIKSQLTTTIEYPQYKFFKEENLSLEKENIENVRKQLDYIKKCGFNTVALKLDDIIRYYEAKEKNTNLDDLIEILNVYENDIYIAIKNSFYDVNKLEDIKANIKNISEEKSKIINAKMISDIDYLFKSELYSDLAADIKIQISAIEKIEEDLKKKQDEIRDKEKGNKIITALSNLVIDKEGIYKYKNEGNNQCPLCGSDEKFSKISHSDELATEAEAYLKKSKSDLASMKKIEQEIIETLNAKFEQFIKHLIKYLDEKIKVLENQKNTLLYYFDKTKMFFDKLRKFDIPIDDKCIDKVKEIKADLMQVLINENSILFDLNLIKNILTVLEYKADFENITVNTLKKIQMDIKLLCDNNILFSDFSFDLFNKKLLFINNILNNHRINEKEVQIKRYLENNKDIDDKIKELEKYKFEAKKIRNDIESKKAEIEKEELKAVGPYLHKIFTKIVKHTSIKEFVFKRDGSRVAGGATFTDQNNNNILNTLSQGQMGIFMLSYFIGNMFKRKEETHFKTYFVDDITSCMDDMNILSFVDIIKYQLYKEDGVINQFFFSTCDNDLETLFIHKMDSFNVKWTNIKFRSYARGTIHDNTGLIQKFGN